MNQRRIYLDNAATTWPKPKAMLEKMMEIYHEIGVSPGRGSYDQAVAADDFIDKTRQKVAAFFGASDPQRVIFTANATDGLNLAILGMVKPGDHVITTRLEHNSVLRPLYHLQQTQGLTTTLVPFDENGFVDPQMISQAIVSQIDSASHVQSKTGSEKDMGTDQRLRPDSGWDRPKKGSKPALVVVNHASNVLGTVQPLEKIGEICNAFDIPLLVDASQSAGLVSVNMEKMKASAMIFTGHKSLYGPTGMGGLILHPDLAISTTRFGGTGMESKSLIHTQTFPHRLEAGTHNLMGIIGLSLALDDLRKEGISAIHQREMTLAAELYRELKKIPNLTLYGGRGFDHQPRYTTHQKSAPSPTDEASNIKQLPLFCANINGIHPQDLGAILDGDYNIAVRAGLHCAPLVHESLGIENYGAIRFSLGRFNTMGDIHHTIHAMASIARNAK